MSEPREIPNHTTRSVVAASGCGAMVFGSLFLAVGLGMLALVSNRYAEMPQEKGLLAAAGLCLVFAGAGGLFVTQGARGIVARRRRKRLLTENPGEPWLADHAWSGPSLDADRRGGILHGLGCIAVSCLFLAPFNWWAFASGDASLPLQAVVGLVDLGPIVLLAGLAYEQARRARWGRARLELDAFPLFVGERLTARLVPARSLVKGTLELTLRCVEERHEARRSGNRTSNVVVAYAHHEARHAVDLATAPGETRVSFDLPRDGPATRLSSDPPTYWELLAKAETPGIDFEETFLLPVYKRGETLA